MGAPFGACLAWSCAGPASEPECRRRSMRSAGRTSRERPRNGEPRVGFSAGLSIKMLYRRASRPKATSVKGERSCGHGIGRRAGVGSRPTILTLNLLLGVSLAAAQTLLIRGGKLFDAKSARVRENTGIAIANGRVLYVDLDTAATVLGADLVRDFRRFRAVRPGGLASPQKVAIGLSGDPVPPGTGIDGAVNC